MLNTLELQNFKSWKSASLRYSRITGLFGTNSSGKTSLIQFLLLLKQTKEATDRAVSLDLVGQYASLGTYAEMINAHDTAAILSWSLGFDADEPLAIVDPAERRTRPFAQSASFEITGRVASSSQGPQSNFLAYRIGNNQTFTLARKRQDEAAFDLKSSGTEFRFVRTLGRKWQLPGPIKSYAFPDQARTYFQNAAFLSDLERAYEEQIDKLYYLGPLRDYPRRDYTWARTRPRDVGIRGEKVVDAILAATAAQDTRNLKKRARLKSFQEIIAYWLEELGLISAFSVEELAAGSNYWQARVTVSQGGPSVLLTDVGFGVSQILPIITLLYYVPEGSTVILEQPEIHLHPLAQSGLADLLINVSEHRNVQVIVESHSEHLLLRLQRRVAEGALSASDVKLYFCNLENGASKHQELNLNVLGEITNWPDKFMGDAFGETLAAERARLERLRLAAE